MINKPLTSIFILAGIVILSFYIINNSILYQDNDFGSEFSITLRHYGWNAREMERSVAIPLEDALSVIPGIKNIRTISENSRTRAFVSFKNKGQGNYDELREAVQRVYEMLPSSAQRQEIHSMGYNNIPFWTAAVYGSNEGNYLDRIVKPALRRIDGIADIEIAGPGVMEIMVILDQEKTAALGLDPIYISHILSSNDGIFNGGVLRNGSMDIPVFIDSRYGVLDFQELANALIPLIDGGWIILSQIADIHFQEREPETYTRLNGNRTSIISLTAVSEADLGKLSAEIERVLGNLSYLDLEFHILEDRGKEEFRSFLAIIRAAIESSVLLAIAVILMGIGKNSCFSRGIICAATIPVIMIISAALLTLMGFHLNKRFLAGLSIGIGCAVDAVILCSNAFSGKKVISFWSPLVSGAVTSVAALLPLMGLNNDEDVTVIALAIGTVTIVSVLLALSLLPPVFFWNMTNRKLNSFSFNFGFKKFFNHVLIRLLGFCQKYSYVIPLLALFITVAAIISLKNSEAHISGNYSLDSVYVQVELEGGYLKEEGDRLMSVWAEEIGRHESILSVQTGARIGSAYGFVTFNNEKYTMEEIRIFIRTVEIPGGFIFIPEPSINDRIWTITIYGDDAEICRDLAIEAAMLSSLVSEVRDTVLNFKDGAPLLTLYPDRSLAANSGMLFSRSMEIIKYGVHGPVAYKRLSGNGEIDLRIGFAPMLSGNDVLVIPLSGNLLTASVFNSERGHEFSGIHRENRRRIASYSVRTAQGDPRYYRELIMSALEPLVLPAGYRIEFDRDAIAEAEEISGKIFNFIWAFLFCYMVIAAIEESFILPLIILSSVLPSLAVPVLILTLSGTAINSAAACALVAVCGMAVNASIISAGNLWQRDSWHLKKIKPLSFFIALKKDIPVLLAISCTSILGSIPFLFLSESNNSLIKNLAFISVFGISISFISSLTLIPSLIYLYATFISSELSGHNQV